MNLAGAVAIVIMFGLGMSAQTEGPSGPPTPVEVSAPDQPIPYSHKTHLALGLKCDFCHPNPPPGIYMSFPPTAKCMQCHVEVAKDRPAIVTLAQYDKSKKQIPWVRVYAVPAWVYWNHRTHIQAGTRCETCHGQVAEMEKMKLATNVTTMQGCIDCHQQRDAPVGCANCHENTSTQ